MTYDVPKSFFCKKYPLVIWRFWVLPQVFKSGQISLLHYNLFKYLFKTSIKIMGCQWEYIMQLYQKPIDVLWKIWVNQPHFHSGPTWWFVQQPYFCLLFNPWLFLLLVVLHVKPLSAGACTFWIIFGPWNNAIYFLSRIVVLQNLH